MSDDIERRGFLTTLGVLAGATALSLIVVKTGKKYDKIIRDDEAEVDSIMEKSDTQLAIAYSYLEKGDEGNYLFFLGNARDNLRRDLNAYNVKVKGLEIYNGRPIERRLNALNSALKSEDRLPDLEQIVGESGVRYIKELARSDKIQNVIADKG